MEIAHSDLRIAETADELVDALQTSFKRTVGNYHPSYFHYTTISKLSRILDNGFLRLSNIQSVGLNDFREPHEFGPSKMWERTCIGCFSVDRMENNAMWSAYGRPENEAIAIRIPSRVMEAMSKGQIFVEESANIKKCALEETDRFEDQLTLVPRAKLFHHDVAYFSSIAMGEEDEQERRDAVIKLFRDYSVCAKIHVKPRRNVLKDLNQLVGYVKRWQWMYERESRLRVLLPERYAGCTAYVKLPEDFVDRVGIIFGPAFDVTAPIARATLRKFLDARGKCDGKQVPFTESAYSKVLNYDKKDVAVRKTFTQLTYKGLAVSRLSPQDETLYARYLRFAVDASKN